MSSVLKEQMKLLITGYSKTTVKDNVPNDIIYQCVIYLMEAPKIEFQRYRIENLYSLEIQLTGFASKILNDKHFGRYEVNYKDINQLMVSTTESQLHAKKIYDSNCIAFTKPEKLPLGGITISATIKVIAFDIDDKMICESDWKVLRGTISYGFATAAEKYDDDKIGKYFEKYIDKNNNGSVDIDTWIVAMKETGLMEKEHVAKKIFYFICWLNHCDEVTVEGLSKFICDKYDRYTSDYRGFIEKCREIIGFVIKGPEPEF